MKHLVRTLTLALLLHGLAGPARSAAAAGEAGLVPLLTRRGEAFAAAMNAPGDEALTAFARDHLESRIAREEYDPEIEAGAVRPGSYRPADLPERGAAAGGAATTVDDLAAFVRALGGGTLLDASHFQALVEPRVPFEPGSNVWYGFGTILETKDGVRSFGHGGTASGTQFELKVYPEKDVVMIVMSSYNTVGPHELAAAIDDVVRHSSWD